MALHGEVDLLSEGPRNMQYSSTRSGLGVFSEGIWLISMRRLTKAIPPPPPLGVSDHDQEVEVEFGDYSRVREKLTAASEN